MWFCARIVTELLLLLGTGFSIGQSDDENTNNSCLTPSYPYYIKYWINGIEKPKGYKVNQYTGVEYNCNVDPATDVEDSVSICVRGKWKPEIKCSTSDFEFYPEVGKSYKFYTNPQNWSVAWETCRKENAILAMPENKNEAAILRKIFEKYPSSILPNIDREDCLLINFHDLFESNEFVTDTGVSIQYYFHEWSKDYSDIYSIGIAKNIVCFKRNGKLKLTYATVLSIFVCQRNMLDIKGSDDFIFTPRDSAYTYFNETKSYYKIHLNPRTWGEARTICKAEGGNLAVVDNKKEEDFLLKIFTKRENTVNHVYFKNFFLLGFHDIFRDNHYVTVQGDDLQSLGYINSSDVEPYVSSFLARCGSMNTRREFKTIPCDVPVVFFCEIPSKTPS